MEIISLGVSSLQGSCLAYGCWRVAGSWDASRVTPEMRQAGIGAIRSAFDAGYTVFDTADIYSAGESEKILGEALRSSPALRKEMLIVTKCGIRPGGTPLPDAPQRYDLSADYIIQSCEGSLRRMGIETVDLFLLHRPDYLADPEEIAGAFSVLLSQGKVRFFGVSNFRPSLVTALQVACPMPLITNQIEMSLLHRAPLEDGTLDQCLVEKLTPMAWSPLGGGVLAGRPGDLLPSQQGYSASGLLPVLDELAASRNVTRAAVALAWLLRHPARIMPVVGSTNPERIRQAARAADVRLTREEWYRLLLAARGEPLP